MIRAVLDTNTVVSALILRGPANLLSEFWHAHRFTWVVSKAMITEYVRVLAYPKFRLTPEEIEGLAHTHIFPYVTPVKVDRVPPVILEDPSDDIFLAAAKAGDCAYLVSGDKHLLSLREYEGVKIVTIAEFIKICAH